MARYVFTQYLFGGEVFPASLMDARLDPVLRGMGLVPEPAMVERSWRTPLPTFRAGSAEASAGYLLTVPPGVWPRCTDPCVQEFANEPDAAEIDTISKVTKVFNGEIPPKPWVGAICTASRLSPTRCASTATPANSLLNALSDALRGTDLTSRYGFYNRSEIGTAALAEPARSSSGGLLALLALAGSYVWYAGRSSPMRGLGRIPKSVKTSRLRKLAQRRRHEGRFLEARRLEQRANAISRSY